MIFLKTSHLDSHTKNYVKPEIISGVQTGNRIPHDRYNACGIAHACSYIKDDIFMQRRLGQIFTYILRWGQKTCKKSRPYPARAYTTLVVLVVPLILSRITRQSPPIGTLSPPMGVKGRVPPMPKSLLITPCMGEASLINRKIGKYPN